MAQQLSEKDQGALRAKGLLGDDEVAVKEGTVIVAENIQTRARRIINTSGLLLETNRQLLND